MPVFCYDFQMCTHWYNQIGLSRAIRLAEFQNLWLLMTASVMSSPRRIIIVIPSGYWIKDAYHLLIYLFTVIGMHSHTLLQFLMVVASSGGKWQEAGLMGQLN